MSTSFRHLAWIAGLLSALTFTAVTSGSGLENEEDAVAAARGSGLFRSYCASCHGQQAKGDGDIAQYLTIKPADLTTIAQRNDGDYPIDQVIEIIDGRTKVRGHGRGEMPVWGEALQIAAGGASDEEVQRKIRDLAEYLRSIQE